MPRLKPEDIIDKVESHYASTNSLRDRMDADHQLYKLAPYDAGDGYQSYTSNEPQTYADKIRKNSSLKHSNQPMKDYRPDSYRHLKISLHGI